MTHEITARLASLRTAAPAGLLSGSLMRAGLADLYVVRSSPIGEVFVAFSNRGVSSVAVAPNPQAFAASHRTGFGRPALLAVDFPRALGAQLDKALLDGKPGRLPLDLEGLGTFGASVLLKAAEIPRGEIRPYQWVAREIGKPGASRAVGSALARNPVPLIVPCHRVVRSDGTLGRYSLGGDANKRRLLESEGLDPDDLEAAAARGVRFLGSSTTAIFCLPTCRHARTIKTPQRVEFGDAPQAATAGYRPCQHCRPS